MANTYTWDFPQLDTAPTEEAELQAMLDEQMQNLVTPPIVGKVPSGW